MRGGTGGRKLPSSLLESIFSLLSSLSSLLPVLSSLLSSPCFLLPALCSLLLSLDRCAGASMLHSTVRAVVRAAHMDYPPTCRPLITSDLWYQTTGRAVRGDRVGGDPTLRQRPGEWPTALQLHYLWRPPTAVMAYSCTPYGEPLLQSWPTAALPMENPYCSCKPTRVRCTSCSPTRPAATAPSRPSCAEPTTPSCCSIGAAAPEETLRSAPTLRNARRGRFAACCSVSESGRFACRHLSDTPNLW